MPIGLLPLNRKRILDGGRGGMVLRIGEVLRLAGAELLEQQMHFALMLRLVKEAARSSTITWSIVGDEERALTRVGPDRAGTAARCKTARAKSIGPSRRRLASGRRRPGYVESAC